MAMYKTSFLLIFLVDKIYVLAFDLTDDWQLSKSGNTRYIISKIIQVIGLTEMYG
jgi:hypothetical protein